MYIYIYIIHTDGGNVECHRECLNASACALFTSSIKSKDKAQG